MGAVIIGNAGAVINLKLETARQGDWQISYQEYEEQTRRKVEIVFQVVGADALTIYSRLTTIPSDVSGTPYWQLKDALASAIDSISHAIVNAEEGTPISISQHCSELSRI